MIKAALAVALSATALLGADAVAAQEASSDLVQLARALEDRLDARIGLYIHDFEDGQSWEYRADERFPMASTFKMLACATLLDRDATEETVTIDAADLVDYSPVTETMVGESVSAAFLCETTLRTSDNTAANYLLEVLGGPQAVTQFLRETGDETTRLDRMEPELNEGEPGSELDTTTPRAMASLAQSFLTEDMLPPADREQLTAWLMANEVGGPLLRSGIPADWRIADRTGAGGYGTRGIVAVMWPSEREPIVAAIYLTETEASMAERNAAIAEIGAALARAVHE
ncbi:class A beta-lactamase [Devosia sp.]|uniref:class A beta-lactamase n=1 Tax=Devosia sp. TaxID=1871048 RepID=UPI0032C241E4